MGGIWGVRWRRIEVGRIPNHPKCAGVDGVSAVAPGKPLEGAAKSFRS